MAGLLTFRATFIYLISGAALLWTISGCTSRLVYRPVRQVKRVAPVVVDTSLPPMPDAKINDATLAGIDTARIGIRDDVHIWIYDTYSSTKKRTRLMTMGKSLHKILATRPMTEDQAKNIDQSFKEASQELRTIPGLLPVEAETMDTLLYEHTFNTSERLKTYLDYSLLLPADPTLK